MNFEDLNKIERVSNAYLESFGFTWDYLKGKAVLDIGGNDGSFAAGAKDHGIDVITLDKYPNVFYKEGISDKTDYVGGDVYHLPFKPGSFDFVCARYLLPDPSNENTENYIADYLHEVMRVVKEGGEFRVTPAPFYLNYMTRQEVPIDQLSSLGYKVELRYGRPDAYYVFRK